MASRLELQTLLETTLGSRNVYFQPPPTIQLQYPCIIYEWDRVSEKKADNGQYLYRKAYALTIVDRNPDSLIPDKIEKLPYCSFDRAYDVDNMHHYVYRIYY